jgi:hypothetical protein
MARGKVPICQAKVESFDSLSPASAAIWSLSWASFGQAIDQGLARGPRIYPCGAMITTTGGLGDLRLLSDLPRSPGRPLSYSTLCGIISRPLIS